MDTKFGQWLRKARKSHGWTIEELAKKLSVGHGYVASWERGTVSPPSHKIIKRIARVFETDYLGIALLAEVDKIFPDEVREVVSARLPGMMKAISNRQIA